MEVTGASVWKQPFKEGVEARLPSGKVIKLRPVALDVLLQSGDIPDFLTPIAAKTLWDETPLEDIENQTEMAVNFTQLVNTIIPAAILEPKVVQGEPVNDDEISLNWIEFPDKVWIFNVVIQPVELMRKFCAESFKRVELISDGSESGDEAEPVLDDSGPVDSVSD